VASYPILYLAAALWLCRGLRPRALAAPDTTRLVLGALALLGTFVPWMLVKGFTHYGAAEKFALAVISPVSGYEYFTDWPARGHGLWVLAALALTSAVLTDRLLARRRATSA